MKSFATPRFLLTVLLTQTLSIGAMAAASTPEHKTSTGVSVADAWVRATVPGQTASGAFMRITSKVPATLVGFTTDLASTHQLHDMSMDGDVMRMREIKQVPLPAGQTVVFGPGSMHFMLLDLKKPLVAGETAAMTILVRLSNGQQVRLTTHARIERRSPYNSPASGQTPMHAH